MKVKRPRNVSDEELETKSEDFEHGLSEPTIMAYYLQRIRLSEISRHVTDLTCDTVADDIAVHDVAEIDSRFQTILAELPSFLRVDDESRQRNRTLEKTHRHISMSSSPPYQSLVSRIGLGSCYRVHANSSLFDLSSTAIHRQLGAPCKALQVSSTVTTARIL